MPETLRVAKDSGVSDMVKISAVMGELVGSEIQRSVVI
jgi:hypothetical protein